MTFNNSSLIILVVIAFSFYLIYSQKNQPRYVTESSLSRSDINFPETFGKSNHICAQCRAQNSLERPGLVYPPMDNNHMEKDSLVDRKRPIKLAPQITNVVIDQDNDPYSDPIKKQDLYTMYDPLTYPQLRLPREILEKYNDYFEKNGSYPPFGQATQPLFDNPIMNGLLIKQTDENEPFNDNVPSSVPLFRVRSAKNTNRYFYYIIDQRYYGKIEPKIPLDHVKVNGIRYNNADFYGLPELFDGDCIEGIPTYPTARFKVLTYKQYHFP